MDWQALFSVFGFVFLAELGDKTQLAVVTQTCKYRKPWPVFVGASGALVLVTALGALGGQILGRVVPEDVLTTVAALMFAVMGILVAAQASRAGGDGLQGEQCECLGEACDQCSMGSAWDWAAFVGTFGLLFLAELGDKTQLAVLSLSGGQGNPWAVFVGGALALVAVTAIGILGGRVLCRLTSRRVLLWISAVAFVAMGVLLGAGVL